MTAPWVRWVSALAVVVSLLAVAPASAVPRARTAFTFADTAITESSGLVAGKRLFATVNDSGDTGRIFTVDPANGRTVGVTSWSRSPTDIEALAPAGARRVWVADIGDNQAARSSVTVTRVPFGRGERQVAARAFRLRYPDGARDAETLMVHPRTGRLVIVTKGLFGGDVLIAPKRLDRSGTNRMRRVGGAIAIATDGAFFPDGRHVIVRSYARAAVYTWPGLRQVGRWALPDQPQGEGIAVRGDGRVFVSSEGVRQPVLRIDLPRRVARAVRPVEREKPVIVMAADDPVAGETTVAPAEGRRVWPWLVGGVAGLTVVGALVRSLRPRG